MRPSSAWPSTRSWARSAAPGSRPFITPARTPPSGRSSSYPSLWAGRCSCSSSRRRRSARIRRILSESTRPLHLASDLAAALNESKSQIELLTAPGYGAIMRMSSLDHHHSRYQPSAPLGCKPDHRPRHCINQWERYGLVSIRRHCIPSKPHRSFRQAARFDRRSSCRRHGHIVFGCAWC